MDAWLKTHVAWIIPVATALYMAGGGNYRMAQTRGAIVLMIRGVRENFRILRALHIPITPRRLNILQWLPEPLLVVLLRYTLGTKIVEQAITQHVNAVRDEMKELADEFKTLATTASLPTPIMDYLYIYLDPSIPPLAKGSSQISLYSKSLRT
ncbi:MAG TPA: hypothetical protein VGD98_00925 [Ktedonobacteraceae bacterium]